MPRGDTGRDEGSELVAGAVDDRDSTADVHGPSSRRRDVVTEAARTSRRSAGSLPKRFAEVRDAPRTASSASATVGRHAHADVSRRRSLARGRVPRAGRRGVSGPPQRVAETAGRRGRPRPSSSCPGRADVDDHRVLGGALIAYSRARPAGVVGVGAPARTRSRSGSHQASAPERVAQGDIGVSRHVATSFSPASSSGRRVISGTVM